MDKALEREISRRLDRIEDITRDLEVVFGKTPGLMDTRGYDRKCGEVRVHCDWIRSHMGDRSHEWMQTDRSVVLGGGTSRPFVGWES